MPSPWDFLDQFPPSVVRLLARTGRGRAVRWISDEEVAIGSGLTLDRVNQLKVMPAWDRVPLADIRAFCRGCQFDPTSSKDRRIKVYIYHHACQKNNSQPFHYLRSDPKWPEFQRLLTRLQILPRSA